MATASVTNTFVTSSTILAAAFNTNFNDLVNFVNSSVVHVDGSKAFTGNVAGITPTADAHLTRKDYVDGVGKMVGMHRSTTNQSIATSSVVTVILNAISTAGDAAYYDTDTVTGEITVLKAGVYAIEGAVTFDTTTDLSERQVQIQVNGGAVAIDSRKAVYNSFTRCHTTAIVSLSANDVITLVAYQTTGAGLFARFSTTDTALRVVRLSAG